MNSLPSTGMDDRIAVNPDANSGSGTAEGTVATVLSGRLMETRNTNKSDVWNKPAATKLVEGFDTDDWRDHKTVQEVRVCVRDEDVTWSSFLLMCA
ncbi:MAG: hypothetical protein LUQ50_06320 [Methanospirillum sp.]|uniref:hypothetical protein n=1 Tax=Methanospirillum sp. TaxID=45200 RepID=UPI002373D1E3|nr:hypothetical protein [Methanospirillum sp.]MDD1728669.1 hypothetical protein [Methanospirillum sp.]